MTIPYHVSKFALETPGLREWVDFKRFGSLSITPQSFGDWRSAHVKDTHIFTLSAKMSLGLLTSLEHDVDRCSSRCDTPTI
jgi:hypothetical protein